MKKTIKPVMLLSLLAILFFSYINSEPNQVESNDKLQLCLDDVTPDFTLSSTEKIQLEKEIQDYFDNAIANDLMVGASVSIVKCDSIVHSGGYGLKDIKTKESINEESIFRIGSLSKGFASVLAGIEVEQGLLHWDDKVTHYIPEFQLKNKDVALQMTLSNLLSHTTGLPYHCFTNLIEDRMPLTKIAESFKDIQPIGKLGEIYSYQNAVYALGGVMIQKVTGKSLEEELKDKIFEPLDMKTASASYNEILAADNFAKPHQWKRWGWKSKPIHQKYYSDAIAAGGINASAIDMAKWMRFLLGNNPEVMMPSTMETIFEPKVEVTGRTKYYQKWPGYVSSSYGYGWRIHHLKNENTNNLNKVVHHGGSVNDYRSEIALFSDDELGICVLFNSPTKIARTVIPDLYKIVQKAINASHESNIAVETNS